jgi:hypothetical protein
VSVLSGLRRVVRRRRVDAVAVRRPYARHDRFAELLAGAGSAERARLLLACAALYEERAKDPARADECLESVLSFEPKNLAAIQGLERLRRAQGRFMDLALVMERHLPLCPTRGEQAAREVALATARGEAETGAPSVTLDHLFPDADVAALAELRAVADVSMMRLPGDASASAASGAAGASNLDRLARVGAAVRPCAERNGVAPIAYSCIDAASVAALVRQGYAVLYTPALGELSELGFLFVRKAAAP